MTMEYEKHHYGLNVSLIVILLVIFLYVNYMVIPNLTKEPDKPINKTVCNTIFVKEYITVLVTPTPDGNLYYAGEYQSGIRKFAHPFSFIRINSSGLEEMKFSLNVYDYKILNKLHWYNPVDAKYYTMMPAQNKTFLMIFVNIYLDNTLGKVGQMHLFDDTRFNIQIGNMLYAPYGYERWKRFTENDYAYNLNDDYRAQAYDYQILYSRDLQYRSTAGMYAVQKSVLYGGVSNAEDGYILYEIPANTNPESILVIAGLSGFGQPVWKLA